MRRLSLIFLIAVLFVFDSESRRHVIADSASRQALSNASIFNCSGKTIGISDYNGITPSIPEYDYPATIRYLGYEECVVTQSSGDTVFMRESTRELPEVVVESRQQRALHILAYVREYSTLTTYTDTVFLFREKMADYMLPTIKKKSFKGWRTPRVLTSKSYYHYTNTQGLDSVSDRCNHHFSWADWVGIAPTAMLPQKLRSSELFCTDTVYGRYSPTEIWCRNDDRLILDIDVLADTMSRKWVPNLSNFFRNNLDFERFGIRFNYGNIIEDSISAIDLTGYSFNIESNGRGHNMFMFNRYDEPFFVSTYAEVYIIDKEYITVKEAKKWENLKSGNEIAIYEPAEAPPLQPAIQLLVDRVNTLDHDQVRLALTPDKRLAGRHLVKQHFGQRVLQLIKTATGISRIISQRNMNRNWREFRNKRNKTRIERNKQNK